MPASAVNVPPRRLAIWDPTALGDGEGKQAERRLTASDFNWDAVQIRDRSGIATRDVYERIAQRCQARGLQLWLNRNVVLASALEAVGIVAAPDDLDILNAATAADLDVLLSVHTAADLIAAKRLATQHRVAGLLLAPILATPSKPGRPGLGWDCARAFVELAAPLPLLLLGGLNLHDETAALALGAHGIAAIRGAFAATGQSA